jgi:AmmeMemoRadiSam system protein A
MAVTGLAKQEKTLLLELAREAIDRRLENRFQLRKVESPPLALPHGAFVTLHRQGELRGCIGRVRSLDPLYATVQEMAVAAAFQDPRFKPVARDEFSLLEIEISVLSPPETIADPTQIEVGKHGLIISSGPYSGLLLPQVATEWGWDAETFLNHTCLKAGLPENYWRQTQVKIEAFTAQVFSEISEETKPASQTS